MRSSDDTYYNINRLHVVFAVSAALLVAVTVWMFVVDHHRPWKEYQRVYRDRVEPWLADSRLAQRETAAFAEEEAALRAALEEAAAAVPPAQPVEQFSALARNAGNPAGAAAVEKAYTALLATPSQERGQQLFDAIRTVIERFEQQGNESDRRRRVFRSQFNEARSQYEMAAGRGAPPEELARLQEVTTEIQRKIDAISSEIDAAESVRRQLVDQLTSITAREDAAQKALETHLAQVQQFRRSLAGHPDPSAAEISRLPFVDGLGRTLAVEQIWLPELTIDYNFRRVARFDRCITCHQGIDQVEPGTPARPAIPQMEQLTLELATPEAPPEESELTIESLYGLTLASRGILIDAQPTVSVVEPESATAWAGLYAGDAILKIDGTPVTDRDDTADRLTSPPTWGEPLRLEIRRGLPQPYCGHPRLDLFVGSKSPHPVAEYGCTICHGGQGSATDFTFASHTPNGPEDRKHWRQDHDWRAKDHWDFPMLARRFLESSCLQCHHDVTDLEPSKRYPDPPAPKLLAGYHLIRQNGCFGCHQISGFDPAGKPIGPDLRLEPLAAEVAGQGDAARNPIESATGSLLRVGPSLRHVMERFDNAAIDRWIADPKSIRPRTRMPRFFGLHEHLQGKELERAKRFEAVEVEAVRNYLQAASQPLDLLPAPSEVTEPPSAERGKPLFVEQGCVACHRHEDVPEGQSVVGPDLTGLGVMITTETGRAWLTSWIRDPARHSPRTPMPSLLLEPKSLGSNAADGRPRMSDPAADLAAYLLESKGTTLEPSPPIHEADLDDLARTHLIRQFSAAQTEEILARGISPETAAGDLGDATELLAPISREKKLRYVGKRTVRKRGCFGCHDIPGLENTQQIGPDLTDWGRRQKSLLAFEQVEGFLDKNPPTEADGAPEDRAFYREAIDAGRREGFLWQKLRQPRSFDFHKTEHKGYNEQLTMGLFSFTPGEREQIMTFVLGLVADPPNGRYVHSPDPPAKAIAKGRKVLDRYGCAECHTMRMPRWRFRYDPQQWDGPSPSETFDFVRPHFSAEAVAESLIRDRTGWGQAEVVGQPLIDPSGETILDEDDDGNPVFVFSLWEPALINGEAWQVGGAQIPISESHVLQQYPAWGGPFAQLLYPYAADRSGTAWLEAWGMVPPALTDEGPKVQPNWLYDYLLNPTVIRPSVLLRMPRYDLSPAEASALVEYFAAASDVAFPFTSAPQTQTDPSSNHVQAARMDQAMRLVTDKKTYCAKCHLIGDYDPGGEIQTIFAPNLAEVGRRIRPEYLRTWLAHPKSILPYTGMPVNFPPSGPPMGQDLLPGDGRQQLDAVADLLLQYDAYLQKRTSIRAMVDGARIESGNPPGAAQE